MNKKKLFESKQNEILEYMIKDEVYFADFEKIEDYYLRGTTASIKDINHNDKEIIQKNLILKQLQYKIDSVSKKV